MKKIGTYTTRGQVSEQETEAGNPQKVPLFDGRFDTGYRVVGFKIWAANYSGNSHSDVIGKIATNDSATTAAGDFMDASNVGEIAWCATQGSIDGGGGFIEVVDPENLIVEDAYIYVRHGGTTGPVNYMVTFEKYEFNTWRGALAMANERASNE